MKASTAEAFALDTKYAAFPNLIIAYVWHIGDSKAPVTR